MRLKEIYNKNIVKDLQATLGVKSVLAAPRLIKVTINSGVGRQSKDKAFIDLVVDSLTAISGQKPVLTVAKKSISAFKVREGDTVGVVASLRGQRMYDFVEKLIKITLPRVRDFRGLDEKMVDQQGNMTIGFRDQTAFAEIKVDQIDKIHGLEVVISTTAGNRTAGLALFKALGFPFKKD